MIFCASELSYGIQSHEDQNTLFFVFTLMALWSAFLSIITILAANKFGRRLLARIWRGTIPKEEYEQKVESEQTNEIGN